MKNNIQQVKYNEKSDKADWWSWEEICDNCGEIIHNFKNMITMKEPDKNEKDYCVDCMRKYLDEIIKNSDKLI